MNCEIMNAKMSPDSPDTAVVMSLFRHGLYWNLSFFYCVADSNRTSTEPCATVLPNIEKKDIMDSVAGPNTSCLLLVRRPRDVILQRKVKAFLEGRRNALLPSVATWCSAPRVRSPGLTCWGWRRPADEENPRPEAKGTSRSDKRGSAGELPSAIPPSCRCTARTPRAQVVNGSGLLARAPSFPACCERAGERASGQASVPLDG